MRKVLAGFVGLVALIAGPAWAADLPVRAVAPVPTEFVPPFSWTGCFIGGFGGGVWTRQDWSTGFGGAPLGNHTSASWLAGGQGGCDYQVSTMFVIGVQGDYGFADARGNHSDLLFPNVDWSRLKSVYSVTGRAGLAWDHWLWYGRGGVAWAHTDNEFTATNTMNVLGQGNETRSGWTAGVGVEYALNKWMSVFAEYNYYGFGNRTITFVNAAGATAATINIDQSMQAARAGMNVRWGGW